MANTVWIVDDCPLTTRLLKAHCRGFDAAVETLASGNAAVVAFVEGHLPPPDLILMDQDMPSTSGDETGQILRAAGYMHRLYLHTAVPEEVDATILERAGFDGVLKKPLSRNDLRELLEQETHRRSA